jgi:hypothetical protein
MKNKQIFWSNFLPSIKRSTLKAGPGPEDRAGPTQNSLFSLLVITNVVV